jgi:Zn finger protein HypA/HybF involved in hydrogenase expression
MRRILECFDEELVDRAKTALNEARVAYAEISDQAASMTRWCLDVADADEIEGAAIVRSVADGIESARSPMRCTRCGTGMLAVTESSEDQNEQPLVAEYRCPRCGAPGLMNIG